MEQRVLLSLAAVFTVACSNGNGAPQEAAPPASSDAGAENGGIHDAGVPTACMLDCYRGSCEDRRLCLDAPAVHPGASISVTDEDGGGFGDCALSGSGVGGRSQYFRLVLPAGEITRLVATPMNPNESALLRTMIDCDAKQAECSDRGGQLTDGKATLCLRNDGTTDTEVVLAVSQYSGEEMRLGLAFGLVVETRELAAGCDGVSW
jgi:hypothetical protein